MVTTADRYSNGVVELKGGRPTNTTFMLKQISVWNKCKKRAAASAFGQIESKASNCTECPSVIFARFSKVANFALAIDREKLKSFDDNSACGHSLQELRLSYLG